MVGQMRKKFIWEPSSAASRQVCDALATGSTTTAERMQTGTTSFNSQTPTRLESFQCFEQTLRRLHWKLIDLDYSYQRTLTPSEPGFTVQDAARNFKLDFHEIYGLIHQAIVNLLHIFRISVDHVAPKLNEVGTVFSAWSSPAYHHNVLKAIDENRSLHAILGTGDVSQAFWRAEELGKKWKDPDAVETSLQSSGLAWILTEIMGGLEAAHVIAEKEVRTALGKQRQATVPSYTADEMDWEVTR